MIIKSVVRPQYLNPVMDLTGGEFDSTFHQPGDEQHFEFAYANGLLISVDIHGDGTKIVQRGVRFSDHTGLETEWLDGTSATVLNVALQSLVNNLGNTASLSDSTNPTLPNSYQRTQFVNKSYIPSLS